MCLEPKLIQVCSIVMLWITVVSLSSAVSLVIVLVLCICWKRSQYKDEWLGLDGMVKQKNPDENVNHIPLPAAVGLQLAESNAHVETVPVILVSAVEDVFFSSNKRSPNQGNNTHRSLPDIPSEGQSKNIWDAQNGDNSSDLYATLEPYNSRKLEVFQMHAVASTSKVISSSGDNNTHDDSCSPYASVNYDKLKGVEHPYAIVKSPKLQNNGVSQESTDSAPKGSSSNLDSVDSESGEIQNQNINAASAVAGGVAASQDLPYMTPPINIPVQSQINFSGDSQDSSKGYTSISVREPLANIMAHTLKENGKSLIKRSALDPHYSTVSDDSDEMYTTIPDSLNQEYTSGSDTYAQIQPIVLTVAADINHIPSSHIALEATAGNPTNAEDTTSVTSAQNGQSAPQPPSVDSLKTMTGTHSRQDDRESFTASTTSLTFNLGSPKPEKRQANSPLPPPPKSPDVTRRFTSPNVSANIDDMYAKVQKNRKQKRKSNSSSNSLEIDRKLLENETQEPEEEHNYETLKRSPQKQGNNNTKCNDGYETVNEPKDCCYEEPNYEKLKDATAESDVNDVRYSAVIKTKKHNYETIQNADVDEPSYESVKYFDVSYENVSNHAVEEEDCSSSRYPGYETVDSSNSSNEFTNRLVNNNNYVKLNNDDEEPNNASDTEETQSDYERIERQCQYNDMYYETIKSKQVQKSNQDQEEEDEDNIIFEV